MSKLSEMDIHNLVNIFLKPEIFNKINLCSSYDLYTLVKNSDIVLAIHVYRKTRKMFGAIVTDEINSYLLKHGVMLEKYIVRNRPVWSAKRVDHVATDRKMPVVLKKKPRWSKDYVRNSTGSLYKKLTDDDVKKIRKLGGKEWERRKKLSQAARLRKEQRKRDEVRIKLAEKSKCYIEK